MRSVLIAANFLTDSDLLLLSDILKQEELERVAPKLEAFRDPIIGGTCSPDIRIKGARGGRGAGAKSHSLTSLIVQMANVKNLRIGCFREIQESLEESVYFLIKEKVEFLRYTGWKFTDRYIKSPTGSRFIFRGLKDLRASRNIKGLEKFDIFFIEEAATIAMESWNLLLPTLMRTLGAQLWFCYNPEEELDPVTQKIWNRNRKDALCLELKPGKEDNPWWNDGLQTEMEEDFKFDPDEAEHIWFGQPRKQGTKAILSRVKVRAAMDRNIEAEGGMQVGVDPADRGTDKSVVYIRKGLKIIDRFSFAQNDGVQLAQAIGARINFDPSIPIVVDTTGIGTSCRDQLRVLGLKVIPVNFAENAQDKDKYANIVTEMFFTFPIDKADIPQDSVLMQDLTGRQYDYDNKNRPKAEKKDEFRKRFHRSPDDGDACLLCYYQGKTIKMSDETRKALADRRKRG